jgi:small-conductance mechanosensitive channel
MVTGRIVSISNKAVFSEPVFNSTAVLDHLWEELTIPVPYRQDWRRVEQILQEEAEQASSSADARRAIRQTRQRYPVADAEARPRVFVRVTDEWVELTARFVVPVREARLVKDQVARNVLARLSAAGIELARNTRDFTFRFDLSS